MKLVLIFLTLIIAGLEAKLRIDTQWPGGFQGGLEIPIKEDLADGWEVELVFKNRVKVDVRPSFRSPLISDMLEHSSIADLRSEIQIAGRKHAISICQQILE